MSLEADEDEHSIEMQLPYIAKVDRQINQIKVEIYICSETYRLIYLKKYEND